MSEETRDSQTGINPYSAPRSEVRGIDDEEAHLAARWRRLVARIIDWTLIGILTFISNFFTLGTDWILRYSESLVSSGQSVQLIDVIWTQFTESIITMLVTEILLFVFLNTYLLAKRGQTIGKFMMGVRIVDYFTGEIPKLRFSLLMREGGLYLLGIFGLLGSLISLIDKLIIFSENRRCIHDYWGFTKVVEA